MKDKDARLRECIAIRTQLRDLRCDAECKELHKAMAEFIHDGSSATGKFRIYSIDRVCHYTLGHNGDSYVTLKHAR